MVPSKLTLSNQDIFIHEDIRELLWFGDGDAKNYEPDEGTKMMAGMGIRIAGFELIMEDPSVIYTSLPVDFRKTESPKPYLHYVERSPSQRGAYLKYLENPYKRKSDPSNIYLLMVGLERHLVKGNRDKALCVMFKLRETFKNTSLFDGLTDSIVNYALYTQDISLLEKIDFNDYHVNNDQYLICAWLLDFPINTEHILHFANYTFPNYLYIDGKKRLFKNFLQKNLLNETGKSVIFLRDFISDTTKIPTVDFQIFSNSSLRYNYRVKYPSLTKFIPLTLSFKYLFWKTHEDVKKYLAEKRKKKPVQQPHVINSEYAAKLAKEALEP